MNGKTKIEELNGLLEGLRDSRDSIEASSVVSTDGFMLASGLPENTQRDRVAVMSAAMRSLGETAARELARGELSEVYVKGKNGYVVVVASGKNAVLTAIARKEAELGSVFSDMRKTADKVAELV